MAILSFQVQPIGQAGQAPKIIYIETNNTLAEVKVVGFLNGFVAQGNQLSDSDMVLISTKTSPNAKPSSVSFLEVSHVGDDWSLVPQIGGVRVAAQYTTVGGAAAEAITVAGAVASDLAFVQVVDNGTSNVTALQAVVTANTLTVTFSGNPGADTIINYQLLRSV